MGLTPLEGFVGGTRCGSIDPVAVFHLVKDCSEDAGLPDIKVTKAEMVLNKWVVVAPCQRATPKYLL
jgi:acetate kinase